MPQPRRKMSRVDDRGDPLPCSVPGCARDVFALLMCRSHYSAQLYKSRGGGTTGRDYSPADDPCAFPGCYRSTHLKGWCVGHYSQHSRGRDLRPLYETLKCMVSSCPETYFPREGGSPFCRKHTDFKRRFNLSNERVVELHQVEVCGNPGCDNSEDLHMDHDHSCCPRGKVFEVKSRKSCGDCVRGWLCRNCNIALGLLHESPSRIRGLADYVS